MATSHDAPPAAAPAGRAPAASVAGTASGAADTAETAVDAAARSGLRAALPAVLLAGGLATLLLLLVDAREALGPLWEAVVAFVVLWPVRGTRAGRAVLIAVGLVAALFVLQQVGGVLAPFVVAFVLAYVLDPVVTRMRARFGWPRWVTSLVLALLLVGGLVGGLVFLVPMLVGQASALVGDAVALAQRLPARLNQSPLLDQLEASGVVDRAALTTEIGTYVQRLAQTLAAQLPAFALGLTRRLGDVLGLVTLLALFPVAFFYLLKDYPAVQRSLVSVLPRYRGRRAYLGKVGEVFGGYLRGQLAISAVSGVLVGGALVVLGMPFSLVIGLMAGLFNLIPTIGAILTYIFGALIMLVFSTPGNALIVLAVLGAQAFIEQSILTPRIMGQSVGLHPVVIMVSLLVAGTLFGFVGLLLAVPATALLAIAMRARREALVLEIDEDGADPATPAAGATAADAV